MFLSLIFSVPSDLILFLFNSLAASSCPHSRPISLFHSHWWDTGSYWALADVLLVLSTFLLSTFQLHLGTNLTEARKAQVDMGQLTTAAALTPNQTGFLTKMRCMRQLKSSNPRLSLTWIKNAMSNMEYFIIRWEVERFFLLLNLCDFIYFTLIKGLLKDKPGNGLYFSN